MKPNIKEINAYHAKLVKVLREMGWVFRTDHVWLKNVNGRVLISPPYFGNRDHDTTDE